MTYKKYTEDDIKKKYKNRKKATGFVRPYGLRENLFVVFSSKGSIIAMETCKEYASTRIRNAIRAAGQTKKSKDVGTFSTCNSIGLIQPKGNLKRVLQVSNKLHVLEKRLGLSPHVLRCLSVGTTGFVCWKFILDPQWLHAPPVTHFWMRVVRRLFRGKGFPTNNTTYKLIRKRRPSVIFGKNQLKNWEGYAWSGTYGDTSFGSNVKRANKRALRSRFPRHTIFDMPVEGIIPEKDAPAKKINKGNPLSVACPYCKQKRGQRCVTNSFRESERPHTGRIANADRVVKVSEIQKVLNKRYQ